MGTSSYVLVSSCLCSFLACFLNKVFLNFMSNKIFPFIFNVLTLGCLCSSLARFVDNTFFNFGSNTKFPFISTLVMLTYFSLIGIFTVFNNSLRFQSWFKKMPEACVSRRASRRNGQKTSLRLASWGFYCICASRDFHNCF
ncbi:hypothetical protein Hanom_Chr05g00464961 [Helianthus anomalus]